MDVVTTARDESFHPIFKIGDSYIYSLAGTVTQVASNFVDLHDPQVGLVRLVLGSRSDQNNNRLILKSLRRGQYVKAYPRHRETEKFVWIETIIERL